MTTKTASTAVGASSGIARAGRRRRADILNGGAGRTSAAGLPEDVAYRIMAFAGTPQVRLVSHRAKREADEARREMHVSGAGADDRPARLAQLFPNLESLVVTIRRADVWEVADPGPCKVCEYEKLSEVLAAGVMNWVTACGTLRHLRFLRLEAHQAIINMRHMHADPCHRAVADLHSRAITAGTPANPSSPVSFDIRVLRYHVSWAVPSLVVAIVMAYFAYKGYRYYKARSQLQKMV
ncbi:hypothetical protein WJX74_003234 [Apatococcus lobatus]|uniref:Uncharacterized protein n=1 Tax=Apatococcus lobatus TaxID=904363 RepID=A0AAW1SFU8_9CHLO